MKRDGSTTPQINWIPKNRKEQGINSCTVCDSGRCCSYVFDNSMCDGDMFSWHYIDLFDWVRIFLPKHLCKIILFGSFFYSDHDFSINCTSPNVIDPFLSILVLFLLLPFSACSSSSQMVHFLPRMWIRVRSTTKAILLFDFNLCTRFTHEIHIKTMWIQHSYVSEVKNDSEAFQKCKSTDSQVIAWKNKW